MSRFLLIAILVSFFLGCTNNDEDDPLGDDNTSTTDDQATDDVETSDDITYSQFTFTINANIDLSSYEVVDLVLSDEEGNIVAMAPMDSFETTTIETEIVDGVRHDISIHYESVFESEEIHRLDTYIDLGEGTYTLSELEGDIYYDDPEVDIINSGPLPIEIYNLQRPASSSSTYSTQNGGTLLLKWMRPRRGGIGVYFAFKNATDDQYRFYFSDDIPAPGTQVEYSTLPVLDNTHNINFPAGIVDSFYYIVGYPEAGGRGNFIFFDDTENGPESNETIFYPDGFFTHYRLYTTYKYNSSIEHRFKNSLASLPNTVPAHNFTFELSDSSYDNFRLNASGDYDYYGLTFNGIWYPDGESNGGSFRHLIYGEGVSDVAFDFSNLQLNLLNREVNMSEIYISLWDLEGIDSFQDVIRLYLENNVPNPGQLGVDYEMAYYSD